MNVIIKPAGLMLILGSVTILTTMVVVRSQKPKLQELPAIETPIAGFQSTKRAKNGVVSVFDGKDAMETVDLTRTGSTDWVHWGLSGPHGLSRRRGGSPAISDYTLSGGPVGLMKDGSRGPSRGFVWTGGTPTRTVPVTYTGAHLSGKNGFQFRVRTDPRPHTLRVYVGGYRAGGEFSAWLPEGSQPVRVALKETALQTGYYSRVYTVDFRPTAPNQDLKVTWRAAGVGSGGNLSLQAAALE